MRRDKSEDIRGGTRTRQDGRKEILRHKHANEDRMRVCGEWLLQTLSTDTPVSIEHAGNASCRRLFTLRVTHNSAQETRRLPRRREMPARHTATTAGMHACAMPAGHVIRDGRLMDS